MKKYVLVLLAILIISCVAYWKYAQFRSSSESAVVSEVTTQSAFDEAGHIMRDNPGLTPGEWYLSYEAPGSPGLLVRLAFTDESICAGKTASGPCVPSIFIKGRGARVEGVRTGGIVEVKKLTFTTPLRNK